MTTKLTAGDLKSIMWWHFGAVVGFPACAKMVSIAQKWGIDLVPIVQEIDFNLPRPVDIVYARLYKRIELIKTTNRWMIETAAKEQAERLRGM